MSYVIDAETLDKRSVFHSVFKFSYAFDLMHRPVHPLSGIMGNQGKIAKKQRGKIYVYLHISILRFIFERKLYNTVSRETPFLYLIAFLSRLSWALAYLPE